MEKMLAVVLDTESKAYEASRELKQLDAEGSIDIYALAVIAKNADGAVAVKESDGEFPVRLAEGTAIGALIGLLGGPVGVAIGTIAGSLAGGMGELYASGVDAEFVDDTSAKLTPGKFVVIADLSEDWVAPVDTRLERFGGTILRSLKKDVEADQRAAKVAMLRAEIDQLKTEQAKASAEQKAGLQDHIDKVNARLDAELNQVRQRSEQIKKETDAKVAALQQKAKAAHAGTKAHIEAEAKRIREGAEETDARLRNLLAGHLRKAAARVEKEPAKSRAHANR